MPPRSAYSLLAVVLLLSSCGGDGGSATGNTGLPLATPDDVLREIGVLDAATGFVAIAASSPSAASSASSPASLPSSRLQPAAIQTNGCPAGGTDTTDSGTKSRSFVYFGGASVSVGYSADAFSNCQSASTANGTTSATVKNGLFETGESSIAGSPSYRYLAIGAQGKPFNVVTTDSQAGTTVHRVEDDSVITQEIQETDTEILTVQQSAVEHFDATTSFSTAHTFGLGTDTATFQTRQLKANGALRLDGYYVYISSTCGVGGTTISTPAALTAAQDASGYFITGGSLILTGKDNATVTVTFIADGSATYQFQGGSAGVLARSAIQAQISGHPCS